MKNFRPAALLSLFIFAALLFPGTVATARAGLPATGPLKAQAAQALIDSLGKDLVVIDVRSPDEFAQGHAPGARLLPVEELPARLAEVPTDKPVLFVCRTGRRASYAYEMVHKARPGQLALWYLNGSPEYRADGGYVFH